MSALRPVLINSIPKAGTHLVMKALSLVPGMDAKFAQLVPAELAAQPGEETVEIGIGLPRKASAARVRALLAALQPGQAALWHVPYSQVFHAMLRELGLLMLVTVRDPRDVVVSHAAHIAAFPHHRLHERFRTLPDAQRIEAVIAGVRDDDGELLLESLATRYAHLLAWRNHENVHVVRFEDLVGVRGGGSDAAQHAALRKMMFFLGAPTEDATIHRIAGQLFGETITFRKGKVGGWRDDLAPEHAALIERSCGGVLRELGYADVVRPMQERYP